MKSGTTMLAGRLGPLLLLPALGLTPACDDAPPDTEPPEVAVLFPGLASALESPTVIVRGTAADATGVAAVRVNDMTATTSDDFATWEIEITLEPGANTVIIEAEDTLGQFSDAIPLSLFRSEMLRLLPEAMVLDEPAGRALVMDAHQGDLVSVDLSTGVRQVLSPGKPPEDDQVEGFSDMLLDRAQNRVLALDKHEGAVMAIDLDSGARTVLSDAGTDVDVTMRLPQAMAMDPATGRLLVLDQNAGALLAVDLETGDRTMISDDATGTGTAIGFALDMALDAARNRALVVGERMLLAVDLATGDRTVVADATTGSGPIIEFPTAVLVHAAGERALVRDQNPDTIVAVDLATGERTLVVPGGADYSLGDDNGIVLDAAGERIFTSVFPLNGLQAVDLTTGTRELIAGISVGNGLPIAQSLLDVRYDPAHHRLLALDLYASAVLAFDLTTGDRAHVHAQSDRVPALYDPTFLAFDAPANRVIVLDEPPPEFVRAAGRDTRTRAVAPDVEVTRPALLAIDLETRTCELVASLTWEPSRALFDHGRRRVLLFEAIGDTHVEASAIYLDTGAEETLPLAVTTLKELGQGPQAIDASRGRLLLFSVEQGLLGVHLATGTVDVISDAAASPDLEPVWWSSITVDASRDRALMIDEARDALIAIDLETGAREIVFERDRATGAVPRAFNVPAMDETHDRGFLVDGSLGALLLLDFETGMSAIVSM